MRHVGYLKSVLSMMLALWMTAATAGLPETVMRIKPSIVGVGSHSPMGSPQTRVMGTGFVVHDGRHVMTNAHVLPTGLDEKRNERLVIIVPDGYNGAVRNATIVKVDRKHDLALLKMTGNPLPKMKLGDSRKVREGEVYAFTGFPIATVIGLRPVTHRGLIAALTPIAMPVDNSQDLNTKMMQRLSAPYEVFQLDATAYPGNSGSPLYHPHTGVVVGVLNSVFIKETKENVIQNPSGISYAIPVTHAWDLLREAGLIDRR